MITVDHTIKAKEGYIVPVGDIHAGAHGVRWKELDRQIKTIKEHDAARVILLGDIFECNYPGSKSDVYGEMSPKEASDTMIDKLAPIKKKIIAAVVGNHEARSERITDTNPLRHLCDILSIPYCGASSIIRVVVGSQTYNIHATHGTGGASTPGGKMMRLLRSANAYPTADVYLMGHLHQIITSRKEYYDANGDRHDQLFMMTGTMMEYAEYAQVLSFVPTRPTFPHILLSGTEKLMKAVV